MTAPRMLAAALALALCPALAQADFVVDQSNIRPSTGDAVGLDPAPNFTGQSFTAGLNGIDFARFLLVNFNGPASTPIVASLSVSLYAGSGPSSTAIATTGVSTLGGLFGNTEFVQFDFASRISLVVGAQYTLAINRVAQANGVGLATTSDSYSGGLLVQAGRLQTGLDSIFAEGIDTSRGAVPEPASLAMLAIGLVGAGLMARCRAA